MKNTACLLAVLALVATPLGAVSVEREHTVTKIEIDLDDGSEPVVVELDSRLTGFRLQELTDGESRSVDDGSGRNIVVTRLGESFRLNVDGRVFDLPAAPPPPPPPAPLTGGDTAAETLLPQRAPGDGLAVLGADHLSDSDRETLIRAMLETGLVDKVTILDRSSENRQTGADAPQWIERHTVIRDGEIAP